jgi:hypothetical protein
MQLTESVRVVADLGIAELQDQVIGRSRPRQYWQGLCASVDASERLVDEEDW